MDDVALLAGVSLKTVSRVINEESYVSKQTSERVWEAISTLGYRPHFQAAGLARRDGRTRMIGMLLAARPNPFWYEVRWSVEKCAARHASFVVSATLDGDLSRGRHILESMVSRQIDGLMVAIPSLREIALIRELRVDVPIVVVDGLPFDSFSDSVMSDGRSGTVNALRHLVERGHQRVAYLGADSSLHTIQERTRGFMEEAERSGLDLNPEHVIEGLTEDSAYEKVVQLLTSPDPPTALLTAQVMVTKGAIRALRELGLNDVIALVSFDDNDMFELMSPAITVVAHDPVAIGQTAAERLFDRIDSSAPGRGHKLLPTKLIQRGSGELLPVVQHQP